MRRTEPSAATASTTSVSPRLPKTLTKRPFGTRPDFDSAVHSSLSTSTVPCGFSALCVSPTASGKGICLIAGDARLATIPVLARIITTTAAEDGHNRQENPAYADFRRRRPRDVGSLKEKQSTQDERHCPASSEHAVGGHEGFKSEQRQRQNDQSNARPVHGQRAEGRERQDE